ncbi:MAG TPA: YciI-like protein [Povalibacter sp.]|nr:YciI-like protein [Povalibacter sp.]
MHYLLIYDFVPDVVERRGPFRAAHLHAAWAATERGELLLGGALTDPVDTGVLLFNCETPDVPEQFAANDPYVKNGLVSRWRVRRWTTVVGSQAETPVRPG